MADERTRYRARPLCYAHRVEVRFMPRVIINGVPHPYKCSYPLAQALCKKVAAAHKVAAEARGALHKVVNDGTSSYVSAVGDFLSDPDVPLSAAIRANAAIPLRHRATLERCFKIARALDPEAPSSERVLVRLGAKKKSGQPRLLLVFGIEHKMRQHLIAEALGPSFVPRAFQFDRRGVPKAIAAVRSALDAGLTHVVKIDIRDFFASFKAEKLAAELPLPSGWVANAVVGRHMELEWKSPPGDTLSSYGTLPETLLLQARQGLCTGSTCSPLIGSMMLARLPWTPSGSVRLVTFVDDLILLASSSAEAKAAAAELAQSVAKIPGGTHHAVTTVPAKDGSVEFLGHRLSWTSEIRITLSNKNLNAVWARANQFDERLCAIAQGAAGKPAEAARPAKVLAKWKCYLKSWCATFAACEDIDEFKEIFEGEIEAWADKFGLCTPEIDAAAEPYLFADLGYELAKEGS